MRAAFRCRRRSRRPAGTPAAGRRESGRRRCRPRLPARRSRALRHRRRMRTRAPGLEPEVGVERVAMRSATGERDAVESADDDAARRRRRHRLRAGCARAVFSKQRIDLFLAVRQRQPGLQAGNRHRRAAQFLRRALGMDDAAPGGHQVHVAGLDHHLGAERIAVPDLAVEQVGDGRQARYADAAARRAPGRRAGSPGPCGRRR